MIFCVIRDTDLIVHCIHVALDDALGLLALVIGRLPVHWSCREIDTLR